MYMNSYRRLIILCLYSPAHALEYVMDRSAQLETWVKLLPEDFLALWVIGDETCNIPYLVDKDLYVPCEDSNMIAKTALAIQFLWENFDFDYVLRSNTSTYFIFEKLQKVISQMEKWRIEVAGFPMNVSVRNRGKIYCSGQAILMSKNSAALIIPSKDFISTEPDDVTISYILREIYHVWWFTRSDLELLPFWWPSSVVRLKHPTDSFETQKSMRLMNDFVIAKGKASKVSRYLKVVFHSVQGFKPLKLSVHDWILRVVILIKTLLYIKGVRYTLALRYFVSRFVSKLED